MIVIVIMNINDLVNNYIDTKFLHGVNVVVGTLEKDLFAQSYGFADNLHTKKMTLEKVFDLASLTKAVGVSLIAASLRDEGKLDYNFEVRKYLPEIPKENFPFGEILVKDLLIHYSGVDSCRYYDKYMLQGYEELYNSFIYNIKGVIEPNKRYEYNCGNYILLGLIIEAITNKSLKEIAKKYLFNKLELCNTSWGIPLKNSLEEVVTPRLKTTHGTTPKELVPEYIWKLHLEDYLPSDETARWVLPYRIGNAGMFSNIIDLSKIARFILSKPFSISTINLLTTNQAPLNMHPRSCGWDLEKESGFSSSTIHHTGWSGQSMWIDLEQKIFVIVLTCRSNVLDGQRRGRLNIANAALKSLGVLT